MGGGVDTSWVTQANDPGKVLAAAMAVAAGESVADVVVASRQVDYHLLPTWVCGLLARSGTCSEPTAVARRLADLPAADRERAFAPRLVAHELGRYLDEVGAAGLVERFESKGLGGTTARRRASAVRGLRDWAAEQK